MDTKSARERHCIRKILKEIGSPAVKPLLEALRSDDWLSGPDLGEIGDKRAAKPIMKLLGHSCRWQVLSAAATALGKLKSWEAVGPLINLFEREKSRFVRKSVVVALGRIGDPRAIPVLMEALSAPCYAVRYPAKDALLLSLFESYGTV